jgi:hypothetical protein
MSHVLMETLPTRSGIALRFSGEITYRFAAGSTSSFDASARSVDAVISMGSPVQRFYGTEVLKISPEAVDLDRMKGGSIIPLLDSHQADSISHALGRVTRTWFSRGALMGTLAFNETPQGELAMGMVSRGEIAGISAGYCVREWEISDEDGRVIDPEVERIRWDQDGLTFTAVRWALHEASLVSIPADKFSGVRSMGTGIDRALASNYNITDVGTRMLVRQRMTERQSAHFGALDE